MSEGKRILILLGIVIVVSAMVAIMVSLAEHRAFLRNRKERDYLAMVDRVPLKAFIALIPAGMLFLGSIVAVL